MKALLYEENADQMTNTVWIFLMDLGPEAQHVLHRTPARSYLPDRVADVIANSVWVGLDGPPLGEDE